MHEKASPAVVVVTRLAVRRRTDATAPSEAWIRSRVSLLRRIGWPALQRVGTSVAWVLVVDPDRHELVSGLVGDLLLDDGSVHIAEGVGLAPVTSELRLDTVVHPGVESFVTFRLDSDDALLPGSIGAVLEVASGAPEATLIDLPHGYQLDLASGRLFEAREQRWRQGPFLALVHHSRATMLDTGGPHAHARDGRTVRRMPAPAWVQTIHESNASNQLRLTTTTGRARRAVRRLPRGGARAAWVDGRPVAAADAVPILGSAGIVLDR